jgi:hypothetical protein
LFAKIAVVRRIWHTAKLAPAPSAPPSPSPVAPLLFSPCVPYSTR